MLGYSGGGTELKIQGDFVDLRRAGILPSIFPGLGFSGGEARLEEQLSL